MLFVDKQEAELFTFQAGFRFVGFPFNLDKPGHLYL